MMILYGMLSSIQMALPASVAILRLPSSLLYPCVCVAEWRAFGALFCGSGSSMEGSLSDFLALT